MGCLSSARIPVLINGSPTSEFSPSRGVRQGYPLSRFLFDIVMEALHIFISTSCSLGSFHGIRLPHDDVVVSHLLYADDAIFLGEWSSSNIANLARILKSLPYGFRAENKSI
jgi:hypothetical protein